MDTDLLISDYISWLKSEINVTQCGEYYEITTPFLNNSNDHLQIYIKQEGEQIVISDDSVTMNEIYSQGIKLTPSRKMYLESMLHQYGIDLVGDELLCTSTSQTFSRKKHMFLQGMLRVEDLYATTRSKVASFFNDDIEDFFKKNEIYYTDNVQFTGLSGYTHTFDYLLQRSKINPLRMCRGINKPTKRAMESAIFAWTDTKNTRKEESEFIVILNDSEKIPPSVTNGFNNYNVRTILWSQRKAPNNLRALA